MDIATYRHIVETLAHNIWDYDAALSQGLASCPEERAENIRSIVSQEYQKYIRANFRSLHSAESRRRIYRDFSSQVQSTEKEKGDRPSGVIVRIALKERFSPALTARIILEEYLKERQQTEDTPDNHLLDNPKAREAAFKSRVSQLLRNPSLIQWGDLGYEILVANVKDHSYGHLAEAVKHSIGEEHEQKLKDCLTALNIPFSDEHVLRSRGYDKTPDVKLEVPIAVNGKVINWIESKALFGDEESHEGYLKDQFWSYWNRFGPGLVIYWFGYIKQLNRNCEAGIILADSFPASAAITRFQPEQLFAPAAGRGTQKKDFSGA